MNEIERNAINAMLALVDTMKKAQWISVQEKMPECGLRVIATDGTFVGEAWLGQNGRWMRYGLEWSQAFFDGSDAITHWMPLPPVPDGGEQ